MTVKKSDQKRKMHVRLGALYALGQMGTCIQFLTLTLIDCCIRVYVWNTFVNSYSIHSSQKCWYQT